MRVSLLAAYDATAAAIVADDERLHPGLTSRWRDRPPTELEAVCFFDADAFGLASRPAPAASGRAAYDRLEEVVRPDGAPIVYRAAYKNTLIPAPIPAGAGR